jgi:autoinducer 2-degrading protein
LDRLQAEYGVPNPDGFRALRLFDKRIRRSGIRKNSDASEVWQLPQKGVITPSRQRTVFAIGFCSDRFPPPKIPAGNVFTRRIIMYVVSVTVYVKPEQVDAFIEATLDNARNTRHEPGNERFDVSQAEDEPTRFLLYEVYQSKEDFKAHQQTDHYLRWKAAVADAMAQPRQGIKHNSIFFGDG